MTSDIQKDLDKYPTSCKGVKGGSKTGKGNAAFQWRIVGYLVDKGELDPTKDNEKTALPAVRAVASRIPDAPDFESNTQEISIALRYWRKVWNGEVPPPPLMNDPERGSLLHATGSSSMTTNRILFGPPGTGKTYATIDEALKILDSGLVDAKPGRTRLKKRFDEFVESGRVRFVTFHQSFSYEDFVEGLRAYTDTKTKALLYDVDDGVFKKLCDDARDGPANSDGVAVPYVLIIDEINRGNVSRTFGELITLIEPSKRAGADEALEVTLPYSKKPFSVPKNVYIIGTMNTADRSLLGLDIALRRRFEFLEMPARPDRLSGIEVEGVNIEEMLKVMNQRIGVLLDRDHHIGHTYFLPLKEDPSIARLASIFRNQVVPLLQEYFFEDWGRIRLVLNDQNKADDNCFVQRPDVNLTELFRAAPDVRGDEKLWELNEAAFGKRESYRAIYLTRNGPVEGEEMAGKQAGDED